MTNTVLPGANVPKLDLVQQKPEQAAIISKAIRPQLRVGFDVSKRETHQSLNQSKVIAVSDIQKERLRENENILDLFPDILLAEQIVVSSILAPKDMFSENLIYKSSQQILPTSIQSKIDALIKQHLEGHYDIRSELANILKDAIFRTGSYVSAVFPEAAVDEIINGQNYAAESHREMIDEIIDSKGNSVPIGILGPPGNKEGLALENFFNSIAAKPVITNVVSLSGKVPSTVKFWKDKDNKNITGTSEKTEEFFVNTSTENFLEITDNFQLIKLPKIMSAIASQRIKRAIKNPLYSSYQNTSLENFDDNALKGAKKLKMSEFQNIVYKNGRPETEMLTIVPNSVNQKRYSIGRPLRMKIPSEAVIPVFPPGNPSNHRGYFVLVDVDGNWVTRSNMDLTNQGLQALMANQNQSNSMATLTLNKTNKALRDSRPDIIVDNMLEIYSSIVENDMMTRLKNGVYGTQLELGHDKEWDRIMLARALQGKMTRIVYIPSEIITYYAYDYHQNGIGMSYLDRVKMLTSLRAVLLFSKVMAELKNAINVTKVDMTIDPEDPDPQKTIEMAAHDVMKLRENYFPLGVNSPVDLLQWIQRAGLMFSFKGHPGLPDTSFDFSTANLQHQVPDNELTEDLRKQTFMSFGLTPEQVDEGFSPQFATTVLQQNALFARRILLLSNETSKHLSNDVRNICMNDPLILKDIRDVLKGAKDDIIRYLTEDEQLEYKKDSDKFIQGFLERVVNNIWVDLPKPDIGSTVDKAEAFNQYSEALDKVLNSYISPEVFNTSINGEIATHADELKTFWKHHLLRKWVTDEGYMTDIAEIFKRDENNKPSNNVLEVMTKYVQDVMLSATQYIAQAKKSKEATDKDLSNLSVPTGTEVSSQTNSEFDNFDSGGGLDTDSDIDMPDFEKPPEDEKNEESTQTTETTETSEKTDDGETTQTTQTSESTVGSFRNF